MKIKIALASVTLMLLIGACKYFQHKSDAVQASVSYPMLDSASVYDYDSIQNFFPSANAIAYSRKLYLNAVDLFVNKKKTKESLPVFLQSLRVAPGAYTYFIYGNALYEDGQYKIAEKAYRFCQHLDASMEGDATLGRARCYSMQNDTASALDMLQDALQKYPYDLAQLSEDQAFSKFKDLEAYKIILTKYGNSDETRTAALFALFEKNFGKASLPYTISSDSTAFHKGKVIDFRYADFVPGMANGQFSRDVQEEYQYLVSLDVSDAFKTFVYSSIDYNGDTMYPVHQYVLTIDPNDSVISHQEIACSCSPLTIKTAVIDTDHVIEVKEILQTWKQDPLDKGYAGNEVVKQEVKSTTLYQIDDRGNITEIKQRPAKNTGPAQADNENK